MTTCTDIKKEFFMNKISCEFAIITHDSDCHLVTKELSIEPKRFFNKGEKFNSKHSTRVGFRPYGLWAIQSESVISEELDLTIHIDFFQELLGGKIEEIERLKNHFHFECVFAITIETEDSGMGIDLSEAELSFISSIASRFSISFISVNSLR
jgi:hypothetical protein